jgi:ATP-dependent DNA helicase RecQ
MWTTVLEQARKLLKKYYGYPTFRAGQEKIISSILSGRDTLGIMPTGGGKSICYQIPALVRPGTALVVSPLISLMKDQVDALINLGIPATFINSSLDHREVAARMRGVARGTYKLLYIAPERLEAEAFRAFLNRLRVSLLAVDEAHCVSQWGHDFRPSYLAIAGLIAGFSVRPPVAAFTATATGEVKRDIIRCLTLQDPFIHVSGFDRPNLFFSVVRGENKKFFLHQYLARNEGRSGIIYAATRREVDNLYEFLLAKGYAAAKYHAGLSDDARIRAQEAFINDDIQVMVATNAFGMGIDKSNVRFVIHCNMPKNMEAYYQEAGRAGRDGEAGECILLFSPQDIQIQKLLIEQNESTPEHKAGEYRKLQSMIDYCHTARCLRRYILTYFGEEDVPGNCGNCGNCSDDVELVDITVEAQKILSCLWRMRERYGISLVADVLKGARNKKVLGPGFDRLSTYGLLRDYSTEEIKDMINLLIAEGYITMTEGRYPVLKLREKAYPVLKGETRVHRKVRREKQPQADNELFDRLRRLRKEIASREGLPPYMIFPDSTLREMSERCPTGERALRLITGVGEIKLRRYGAAFLEEIRRHLAENETPNTGIARATNQNVRASAVKRAALDQNTASSRPGHIIPTQRARELALAIGETGENIELLPGLFKHPDYEVRRRACSAARKIKDGRIVRHIVPCLYAPEPQVRQYALKAVLESKCTGVVDHVRKVLEQEDKDYNIKLCQQIMDAFGEKA